MSLSIGDIEIAPSDPDVLYVGTGESNAGGGSLAYDGFGIYRSNDAGQEWTHLGLEETGSIGRITVHPQDPDIVYVAAMGRLFSNNPQRGVFRSTDGGSNWDKVLFVNDSVGAIDLIMDPSDPDILYAASWERIRRPDWRQYGGPGCGIYKTTNGGDSWTELTNGLPSADVGRIGIDISTSDPNILYAIYADSIGFFKGIYKTTDKGSTWLQTNDAELADMYASFGWWFGRIHVDPTNPDIVYPIGLDLYKTENGGASYTFVSDNVHVDQHDLLAHPLDNEHLVLGNDGGIYISDDGAASWIHLENLPIMQFYTCEVDEQYPGRYYGGAQDMGTNRTLSGSIDDWHRIYGGDGLCVLVDPNDNNYVYAEYQYGGLVRSEDGGTWFNTATNGISGSDRKNWKSPVIFHPTFSSSLYFGSNKLYMSVDRAVSWIPISPDLSNGPGQNLVYGTITAIATSQANTDYIYCGTDDGNVWVTKNMGTDWGMISDELPVRWVTGIAVDPSDAERAFICLSGYRNDSYLPHVFLTEDAGENWSDISTGLPEAPVNDIIVDPSVDSTLYVATDFGVYVSWNSGMAWQMLADGLPNVPVVDIRLHDPTRKLVAATYGRSMYSFDLDAIVGIEKPDVVAPSISIYPNPAKDHISINSGDLVVEVIRIYSVSGQLQLTRNHPESQLDISRLKAGLHIVEIQLQDAVIRQKVLIE